MTIPSKLKRGDEVRIVTPARSIKLPFITDEVKQLAIERLQEFGLIVSFGKHVEEKNHFNSSSVESRLNDLHQAFTDPSVKILLTVIGGFNSNEVLPYLDYELIKNNPKILCGYSDITALANAIYTKTALVTYSGPHFFDFGDRRGFTYTGEYFKKCLLSDQPFRVLPSTSWSNDRWANDQQNRSFIQNEGPFVLSKGSAKGTIIGGNLITFKGLSGTPYFPAFHDAILFMEEDSRSDLFTFNSNLTTLTLRSDFNEVCGIVFGRFQPESRISKLDLEEVVKNSKMLQRLPIIAGMDFGHTSPKITFPLGGTCEIDAEKNPPSVTMITH
ncbi:MAG TPA: S66 peptidase family protein [Candidatus Bathyarchaeia archaeon]|nr:S66 peptidase family protein [Candidatus Bathyarchaeia archaeon]